MVLAPLAIPLGGNTPLPSVVARQEIRGENSVAARDVIVEFFGYRVFYFWYKFFKIGLNDVRFN